MSSKVLVLVAAGVAWSAVASADALDKAPFTATPAELLAAAKQAPASTGDDDVTVLRVDDEFRFDEHSRITERWRMVALIRTKAGADDWGSLGYEFRPSYQDHPKVRARVIAPDGSSAELDPKQTRDESVASNSDKVDGSTPLPRLVVGSVIEEEVVMLDREPMSAVGASTTMRLGAAVASRISVVAPVALKVRPMLHGSSTVRPAHTTGGGLETWSYSFGATKAPLGEHNMPADIDDSLRVTATSIPSWAVLAKALGARVDEQIAAGPVSLAPELPRSQTTETARAILTWLQSRVEADHVSVSDAAIVPKSPAESLKLGRADDFSMAVAYVGLLRQAGIAAEVALIDAGPGRDLLAGVTAFDDLDHALVRAHLDGREVWIDPTSDALALLTMPATDRHRHALVLAAATTTLVDTPPIAASDNLLRDVRTYELQASGRARITEVRRFGGVWELYARTQERDDPKHFEKDLADDAKSRFAIDGVERMTVTKPTAPAVPFEVTSVMTSPRGFTAREEAQVWLFPDELAWALPDALVKADEHPRTHDYEWAAPHIYEIEHRIVVPDGYAMPAVSDRTRDLGTIKLTETQRIAGNVLTVTMRLDTGKLRITPAELQATRKALQGLADENEHFVFSNVAHQLFEKGAWKDSISEASRVIRAHPKDGKAHAALAELLVEMGLGEAGRREARLAVQLGPNDADNHVILGWALAHDAFGRLYAPGHDHAGARTELEKARKLDPKHVGAAVELGNLLARDERGNAWERGADPKACAVARRAANELEPSPAHAADLARALLWAGDYGEAEKVMRAAKQSDDRDTLLIAAVAAGSGPAAAIRAADGLGSSDARTRALKTAGGVLFLMRHYSEMRAIYAELAMFGAGTPQGDLFAKLAVHDRPLDVKTPAGAAVETELAVMRGDKTQGFWDAKTAEELSVQIDKTMRAVTKASWMPHDVYSDIARSIATSKVEGDSRAWRIELISEGKTEILYAAGDRGAIKLIGAPSAAFGLGRHALRLLAKNDVEGASRVLDWFSKDAKQQSLFEMVWGVNHGKDRDAAELAAAVLSGPTDPDHALAIVEKCTAAPPKADLVCLAAIDLINRVRGAHDDTIAQMTARLATHPKEAVALRILAEALALAGRAKEAEALLPDITAPFDRDLDKVRFEIALAHNDLPGAIKIADAETKTTDANARSFNSLAWIEVVANTNLTGALAAATESVRIDANDSNLHTKAVVEAEVGDLRAAIEDDHKAIELRLGNTPKGDDWYVLGRVAELIGMREDAISAYKQVKPRALHTTLVPDTDELARRRLAAVGQP